MISMHFSKFVFVEDIEDDITGFVKSMNITALVIDEDNEQQLLEWCMQHGSRVRNTMRYTHMYIYAKKKMTLSFTFIGQAIVD
jgi:hypothetical protein